MQPIRQPIHALFVGAHPDDIELGAGGLVQTFLAAGFAVSFVVLTDESHFGPARRQEAIEGAARLGIARADVHFAGFPDGGLQATAGSVRRLRDLLTTAGIRPDLVVAHSAADSHNDHVQANQLARATIRRATFLYFTNHLSGEVSRLRPRFFINLGPTLRHTKRAALERHRSQRSRLDRHSLTRTERTLSRLAGVGHSEAFEVEQQVGASPEALRAVLSLNDSPFHRLWLTLLGDGQLHVRYGSPRGLRPAPDAAGLYHESIGRDLLREKFAEKWFPASPLHEQHMDRPGGQYLLKRHNVMLLGGAGPATVPWPEGSGPGPDGWPVAAGRSPQEDFGLLETTPNPVNPARTLIRCRSASGIGSRGLLRFLAAPESDPELLELIVKEKHLRILVRVRLPRLRIEALTEPDQRGAAYMVSRYLGP